MLTSKLNLSRRLVFVAVLTGSLGLGPLAMAQERTSTPMGYGSGFGTPVYDDSASGSREWIFFPIHPPVLGAEIAVAGAGRLSVTPESVREFLTDPFFAPLATRIIHVDGEELKDPPLNAEESVRVDACLDMRAGLLREIHDLAGRIRHLDTGQRIAAFQALARSQGPRLAELEANGEWLRARLARSRPWSEYREWRLNRGVLKQPRIKTYVLEFQVVRAAAYYQAGFSPAQRRLVRELAIEMSETIATNGQPTGPEFVMFFSPETTRILRPQSPPAELESLIERYLAEKRRLKDELRESIYVTDGYPLGYTRKQRLASLAEAQSASIDHVENLAEQIRRGIAHLSGYRRLHGAVRLSASLEERLQAFARDVEELDSARAAYVKKRVVKARVEAGGDATGQVAFEAAAQARAHFEVEQSSHLIEHEQTAEALLADLAKELPPEEAQRLNGPADIALRDTLARRTELDAYADYDLAALEPGLSPAQRRLLLAAAMARLRVTMLPPEIQPVYPPGTLLGIGG